MPTLPCLENIIDPYLAACDRREEVVEATSRWMRSRSSAVVTVSLSPIFPEGKTSSQ